MLKRILIFAFFIISANVFAKDLTPSTLNALQNFDFVAGDFNNYINMSTFNAKAGTEIAVAVSDTMDIVAPLNPNSQQYTITQCIRNGNNNAVGYYLKIKKDCVITLVLRHLNEVGNQGRVTIGVMSNKQKHVEDKKHQKSDSDDVFLDLSCIRKSVQEYGKVSKKLASQVIKSVHEDVLKPFHHSDFAKQTKHKTKEIVKDTSKKTAKLADNARKDFNKLTKKIKFRW